MFSKPFLLTEVNGAYVVRRGLLESIVGGADYFSTEGTVIRGTLPDGQIAVQNRVNFEGWRHDCLIEKMQVQSGNRMEDIVYERGSEFQT